MVRSASLPAGPRTESGTAQYDCARNTRSESSAAIRKSDFTTTNPASIAISVIAIVRMVLTTIHASPRNETLEIYVTANITAAAMAEMTTAKEVLFITRIV